MTRIDTTTFSRFDTICSIQADVNQDILAQAEDLCGRLDLLYSRFNPQSELYRLNTCAGDWVEVDLELAKGIATALRYCEATGGLFDVTMGRACELWDFKRGIVPPPGDLNDALGHVGWQGVHVEGDRVRIDDPQAIIDLGGVAKGIIADGLASFLIDHGATTGCINLGGNVMVIGAKPDGAPWRVGLRTPTPSIDPFRASTFATVEVCGKSVVTSGVFERAFAFDHHLMHHILDPRTGAPAVTDVLSATVISDRSTDGDGFTTALIIMGAESALAFAEKRPEIEAILFTAEGKVLHTSGLQKSGDARMFVLR